MIVNKENRFFHVTSKKNLHSILSRGLVAQIGDRSKMLGEQQNAVYLFPTIEDVDDALMNWLGECLEDVDEIVILQIDVPKNFSISQDIASTEDDFYEVCVASNIPSEYITAVYDENHSSLY